LYVIKIFVVLAGIDVRLVAYQIFNNHAEKKPAKLPTQICLSNTYSKYK